MADNKFYPKEDVLVENGAKRGSAFVDFAGLDYFWSLAKKYVDTADAALAARATALETTVNGVEGTEGLVQKVATLRAEVNALGGAEGGIKGMIDAALTSYSTTEQMNGAIATALTSYSTTEEMNGAIETAVKSETDARVEAVGALTDVVDALSEVVGAPAVEGGAAATGIFGIIEENEKTTAEALTKLDGRVDTLETAKTDLQGQITSMETAYKAADTELNKDINDEVTRATKAEEALAGRVGTLETTVGNETSGLVQKVAALGAKDTELSGDIEKVSKALEEHKVAKDGDVSIHVSADDRTKWNSAATKINAFLDENAVADATVDTLVEIQKYITEDGKAADELVKRVGAIETTVNGTEAAEYADGLVKKVAANAQAIVDAEARAKKYTDDTVGTWTVGETPASGLRKEVEEKVAAAEAAAKAYTDGKVDGKFDAAGSAAAAEAAAKAYTDELYGQITFVTKDQIDDLFKAQN